MAKHWIQGAIKHPGALHEELGVPKGEKIPQGKLDAAAKKGGKLGARARLAKTLEGMDHKRKAGSPKDEAFHAATKKAMTDKAAEDASDDDADDEGSEG